MWSGRSLSTVILEGDTINKKNVEENKGTSFCKNQM